MANSSIPISILFTLLCLWSSTAVFGREIPTEENGPRLENDQLSAPVDQDLTARVQTLEETNLEQRREISAQNETLEKLTGVLSSVQNELESKARKNETDILEKELTDIRREFEELKKSGSKLSSLPKNIPHTTTCGGLVTVQKEHEIRYQVPSPENRNESESQFCIWIVENSERLALILELKDVERGEDFQLWTTHGFGGWSPSLSQKIHELDSMYSIPNAHFVLYFRINPSTINNNNNNETISFKLNIKRNIFIPLPFQNNVKMIDLTPKSTSNSESFSYPLAPSTQYSANERTYIILKPAESGSSLWLKMKSVDTQKNADWIKIMTFSERPFSQARLSGTMTPAREFRSGVDEPILVFFRSDEFEQRSGFSFDYAQENASRRVSTTQTQHTCGGFVPVDSETEISYQVPSKASSSVCIWVVKNEIAGRLQVELVNKTQWNNHESTELFIIHSIKEDSSQKIPINIQDPSVPFSYDLGSYFLLYFRFNPNLEDQNHNNSSQQGFQLRLQDNSAELPELEEIEEIISHFELTPSSTPTEKKIFSYPVGATEYQDNEKVFIIIKPTSAGSKIKIDMTAIDTDEYYDHVQIMSYSEQEKEMAIDFSFSGTFLDGRPRTVKGRENEPVIVYFSSDGADTSTGFRFTYSERQMRINLDHSTKARAYGQKSFSYNVVQLWNSLDSEIQDEKNPNQFDLKLRKHIISKRA